MEFSIPFCWYKVKEVRKILDSRIEKGEHFEIYFNYPSGFSGKNFSESNLFAGFEEIRDSVSQYKREALRFSCLLDSVCLGNKEFSRRGQKQMRDIFKQLARAGIDSITLSNIYLAIWLKKNYPHFSLTVSSKACLDSLEKIKYWQELGADSVILPPVYFNKNLKTIAGFSKNLNIDIGLVANNGCLRHCPLYLNCSLAEGGEFWGCHINSSFFRRSLLALCPLLRLKDSKDFIKTDWIRPEDLDSYEEAGVRKIRLAGDDLSPGSPQDIVKAYIEKSYEGNLLDLLYYPSLFKSGKFLRQLSGFFLPFEFEQIKDSFLKKEVFLDNKELNTFLKDLPADCTPLLCNDCLYCDKIAASAFKVYEKPCR
ncbi:MAG: hypothetical protein GF375_03200 [Candidatus Omnitrophica bacterium]|nr:hypothetical protein [Candidatus Omnitrophota bacterium]MBD3269090.1 hypothetical protein [Candidatus Omnitrophota bacterium]